MSGQLPLPDPNAERRTAPAVTRRSVLATAGVVPVLAGGTVLRAGSADALIAGRRTRDARRLPASETPLRGLLHADGDQRWTTGQCRAETFSVAALTWDGDTAAALSVRTRTGQKWSGWTTLRHLDDAPDVDPGTQGETAGEVRSGTEPLWVGRAQAIDVRVEGEKPSRLHLVLIDADPRESDRNVRPSIPAEKPDEAVADGADGRTRRRTPRPALRDRKDWGANEKWAEHDPVICRTIQQVHIHHSASSNGYARRDVPGMIRSFYAYHTQSLGWSDIGYNFLVDRFGRIWVGRAGGPNRPIRGAHTLGFNDTSVGICVIGNYEQVKPSAKAITAIVKLASWKLHMYHRRPGGSARVWSHSSDKYPKREWVRLRVIDGHRDTNDTACPGIKLYRKLPRIRKRTRRRIKRHGGLVK
ncbi:N-acetylmuramoyl-L-alanine amidase [Nocardioides acrostichi]|uniref:N-acetylmuramoyl-L-alanine amidase n=1 Tax=Nocardioides acrostichi TaxID=2784339 RepID=A0A930Y9A7_9ACTN|nr:N-acetylmuramoyl-L-alanine amidase [Nocardioides acrostichi]MBF4160148.1 N-acetylmuramoyl-L-alanine amidase [Nocardioides acrostichi]